MEFKLKHPYQLDTINGVEIEDDIVRLSWSKDNQAFSKNTFVNINVKRFKKIVYRILKGASVERIEGSEVLVSYSTFKQLQTKEDAELEIKNSNFWERNFLFYINNPDLRLWHKAIRVFLVSLAAFVVSIIEILQFFQVQT